jgi:uncharacterized protein (DUF1501 family)
MSRFLREWTRRDVVRMGVAAAAGMACSPLIPAMARAAEGKKHKACILLWMPGGPSQLDTFDPKPGHKNGGPVKAIETAAAGVRISEYLPKLAKETKDLAVVRSLSSQEGDHQRATQHLLTGYRPQGPLNYPVLGSVLAKELGDAESELPAYVSIAPFRFAELSSAFLGPRYAPLVVSGASNDPSARANLVIENLTPDSERAKTLMEERFALREFIAGEFTSKYPAAQVKSHSSNYDRAARMVRNQAKAAFRLDEEPASLRDAYGRNRFGQGCLLARRLVERGVPFVEVSLSGAPGAEIGWDTHADTFNLVKRLCDVLDPAWATLMTDLRSRGLLEDTLVVWMGEFGRTPEINMSTGRDHFPAAWSVVLGGAGIRGGQVLGSTGASGQKVEERPVSVPELYATICEAVGIDSTHENISPEGRPIPIVDGRVEPVSELLKT